MAKPERIARRCRRMPAFCRSARTAVVLLALLVLAAGPAAAQVMVCGQRADIVARLTGVYAEEKAAAGITRAGLLVELFRSAGGSWTILQTIPGGPTCMVASGTDWIDMPPVFGEKS